jgi:hypothetical protein
VLLKFQIEIYQWLVPLIAIFFMYRIIVQFRNNKRLLLGTIIWTGFWIIITILAVLPDLVSFSIAETLGFKSHINAVIFVALGFLFIMTYYQSTTLEKLEKQITELIRKIALEKQEEIDRKKKDNNAS